VSMSRGGCCLFTGLPARPSACRTSFKDVGKGWYNLAESNFEAYRFSKLRRFLALVRYGMEDTLRYLVEGSIVKFTAFMQVRTCLLVLVPLPILLLNKAGNSLGV